MNPKVKQLPNGHWVALDDDGNIASDQYSDPKQAEQQRMLNEYQGLASVQGRGDQQAMIPSMSSPNVRIQAPATAVISRQPISKALHHDNVETIDLDELHRRALARADEVPSLLASTGYGSQQRPPQMQTPVQHSGASLNFMVGDPQAAMPGRPNGAISGLHQMYADDGQNPPEMQTPAVKSVTELAQMKDKNAQRGMYDPEGYYIGAQKSDPHEEINRLEHAMQLQQPDKETRAQVQASIDANKIKSQKPEKVPGQFEPDERTHSYGAGPSKDIDFLDEIAKTFKLTSDPAAKSDIRSAIGKPQYGEAKPGSRPPRKHNYDEEALIEQDQLNRGMVRPRETRLYSPPGLKTQMTPPPGSQNWNSAQWDQYHSKMGADASNAQFNQGYQQSHQTQTQQQIQEAQNSPQMRQWRDYNDTSGPAPGQNIQEWAMHRLGQNGGFGEPVQNSPMPGNAPGMNAGQPGNQWVQNGQGKVYIDQYGRERNQVQHSSDQSALESGAGQPSYIPGRTQGAIVQGQSGSADSRIQAQNQGEAYYRHQRYGNRGWDLGDMLHGATGGFIGDQMQGPAAGQSEADWEMQQDQSARQSMIGSDPKEKGQVHASPASHEVDGFLDSLAQSYATYRYKDPSKEPTEQPTGGRYMGVMAPAVQKSPTGGTIVKKDEQGLEYLDEKPSLSAALAALGRLHERLNALERGRK